MTSIQTLVNATAEVVQIVSLKQGDVYKRLEENSYSEKYSIAYGVVTDVMHNGSQAAVVALEFEVTYAEVSPKLKTFGPGSEVAIFAAQPEEVRTHFQDLAQRAAAKVKDARANLDKAEQVAATIANLVTSSTAELTPAETIRGEVTA